MTARNSAESARDIPEATVARLPVYLRALITLGEAGTVTCSSEDLAVAAGVNSAKLRKDLSYLGSYGTRGVGYDVDYLRYQIAREIGVTQDWPVVIVGIGNLGQALANYSGFRSRGFRVVALLDADPARHDEVVAGIDVRPFDHLEESSATTASRSASSRRPPWPPRGSRDRMVAAGITSVLNFAPDGADRAARGRRPQGRPVHRAADPRLPRAAQDPGGRRMSVLVVGISHKSAPVAMLERVALDTDGVHKLIDDVAACEHVTEATVIATCNRLEIYAEVDRFHGSVEDVSRLLVDRAGETSESMLPHLYVHYDDGAVSHLFQVVAGLDSMAIGEGQILGQARDALSAGQEIGTVGPALNVLFQQALRVGKRARAETDIDRAAPSLVTAALDRSHAAVGDLTGKRVVVLGAGAMAGLATATVSRRGAASVTVVNRTAGNGARLAEEYAARSAQLDDLAAELAQADVVVACTGATGVLVTREMVDGRAADGREVAILDLALPHDVDPAAADLPGVTLISLADLADELRQLRRRPGGRGGPPDRDPGGRCLPRRPAPGQRDPDRGRAALDGDLGRRRRDGAARSVGSPTSTPPPAPRCCTRSAGSPTSCCTSPRSGSASSPTRPARCPTPPPSPSSSRSTPRPSTPSPARRV